jgi:hypothetical protein
MDSNVYMWAYFIGIPIAVFIIGVFAPKDSFFGSPDELTAVEAPIKLFGIALIWPVWVALFVIGCVMFLLTKGVQYIFDAGAKCREIHLR